MLSLASFFIFPIIYLLIWNKKNNIKEKKSTYEFNVLIIPQLTRIGDLVASTPVFRAIKEKFPEAHVSVLVSVMAKDVLVNNPRIDEIIILENYQKNFLGLLRKIKAGNFDWGVSLSGTALSSLLFFYGLIPNRIKITRNERPLAEILTDWLINIKQKYENFSYLPIFYLKTLENMGIKSVDCRKEVFLSKKSNEKIEFFFKQVGILNREKVVGMSITAGNSIKEWGEDKFEILAKKIKETYGLKIVFIGSKNDNEKVDKLLSKLNDKLYYINATGFSIEELPSLIKKFFIFISVDTGPMHIAHALNIPLIDILGPVNDIELTPNGENVKIIKPNPPVPPTIFAFKESGSIELTQNALENISVPQVLSAFGELYDMVIGTDFNQSKK